MATAKKGGNKKIIRFRPELFGDVDPKTIDPKKNAQYVIERILDFGDDREVAWLWHFYQKRLIAKAIANPRALFPRTKALWRELVKTR